jgi:uncharacterized protein DUF5329
MKIKVLILLLVLSTRVSSADNLSDEIQHLLSYVAATECTFIRNGKPYDSDDTVSHIKKKYAHFKNKINTTEEFIEFSASKSLVSDKPYSIECEGQATQLTKQWLLDEVIRYRSSNR